jgi:hypothetical protein
MDGSARDRSVCQYRPFPRRRPRQPYLEVALLTLRVVLAPAGRMTILRRLTVSIANAVAFLCIVGVGIVAGYFLAATEAVEDLWEKDRRHHTSKPQ